MKYNPLNAFVAGLILGAMAYYVWFDNGSNPIVLFSTIIVANIFAWLRPIP